MHEDGHKGQERHNAGHSDGREAQRGLGTIGGFLVANMVVEISIALGGAFLGMMFAWRRRNPLAEPQTQSKPRKEDSRRSHYGISRA